MISLLLVIGKLLSITKRLKNVYEKSQKGHPVSDSIWLFSSSSEHQKQLEISRPN